MFLKKNIMAAAITVCSVLAFAGCKEKAPSANVFKDIPEEA